MKDFLFDLVRNIPDSNQSRSLIREYLQVRILESLQRSGR